MHVMNVDGGGGIAPHTQTWYDLEVMASCLGQCTHGIENPSTRWIGWVGSRADIGILEEEKNITEKRQNVVHSMW